MQDLSTQAWKVRDRFLELRSQWMTLIGEHLQTPEGQELEYWRIEKADSVIVLPIQRNCILLPSPSYRPGIGQFTLDFPGGRVAEGQNPTEAAMTALQRELGIVAASITELIPLNNQGWAVNSSFSNQKLYGFVAHIQENVVREDAALLSELAITTYPVSSTGVHQLLQEITCLQCRAVLLEWWFTQH